MRIPFWPTALLVFCVCVSPAISQIANYTPTATEVAEIDRLTGDYYHALDAGDFKAAYAMQTPGLQALMTLEQFETMSREGATQRGPAKARTRTGVTWYLDPPDAGAPGLYVAVDFTSQHVTVTAAKEYVVWFRARGSSNFRLMRHEQLADMTPVAAPPPQTAPPLIETGARAIGYATVAQARSELSARKDVVLRPMQDGWLVAALPTENAVWSFAPPGHPAYPSAVKRFTREQDGAVVLDMVALCEASKTACDDLIREFQALNDAMIKNIREKNSN